jgi:hypothetical protein
MKGVMCAFVVLALAAAGCGAGASPARVTIARDGRIGPLRFNISNRTQVVAFAGTPTSEVRGRVGRGFPAVDALYYGCHHTAKQGVSEDFSCKTIFWLASQSGTLADFWTRDPRYATASGVDVGMSTTAAEHATHATAAFGCGGANLPGGGRLVLYISGARMGRPPNLRAIGGHVSLMIWFGNDESQVVNC